MKLGFLGMGGMGKAMSEAAKEAGHEIVATFRSSDRFSPDLLQGSELVLEATNASVLLEKLPLICETKTDVLIASTGWYDQMSSVRQQVIDAGIRCMYSANYSIGVQLYYRIIEFASKVFNKVPDYDIWATELHHKNKKDSPSGTAMDICSILLDKLDRKTAVVTESLHRKIEDHEIHFSSTRGGAVNFKHEVVFDAEADSISLVHSARNRSGYARGAILCAEWLKQQDTGFYSMEDFMRDLVNV